VLLPQTPYLVRAFCALRSAAPPSGPPETIEEAPEGFKPTEVTFSDIVSLWVTNIMQTCVRFSASALRVRCTAACCHAPARTRAWHAPPGVRDAACATIRAVCVGRGR
jgi:hypothetical protein